MSDADPGTPQGRARPMAPAMALFFGMEALVMGLKDYEAATKAGAWTAASIGLGMTVVVALTLAVVGWLIGAASARAYDAGEKTKAKAIVVGAAVLVAVIGIRGALRRAHQARLRELQTSVLAPARARAVAQSGTLEELRMLAWNRSCPPDLLESLARSPDEAVRADVAGNPSTPAAVVETLSRDPSEAVRYYAASNPARRR